LARRSDIVTAMRTIFADWFTPADSWAAWRAFLGSLFGLALGPDERAIYERHTGRKKHPTEAFREAHLVVGRRGGKSRIVAFVAIYLACFRDYRQYLAPGERARVMVIAQDRKAAGVVFGYIKAMLLGIPLLAAMVEGEPTAERVNLKNGVTIEIQTASFRGARGYTTVAALADEIAFWRSEDSANPDHEIIRAIRPGMATIPNSMLLCLSSPYARKGVLWEAYENHFGRDSDVLVWAADTLSMHPTLDRAFIEREFESDPVSAASEYGKDGAIQFRRDIEGFLSKEDVEGVTVQGRKELPFNDRYQYSAFVDPSGGTQDSMTMAIAHREGRKVVLDVIREQTAPFDPETVTDSFCVDLKRYKVSQVKGDHYAGEWPRARFRKNGIRYDPSDKTRSDIYRDVLPMFTSGELELLQHPVLKTQLVNLERRVSRAGKDSIDHPPGGHDDVANSVSGVCVMLAGKASMNIMPILIPKEPMRYGA
jgi:hypothetical protein